MNQLIKRVIKFGIMSVRVGWLMLTMLRNPTLVWWSSDTSIVHRLYNWDRSSYIDDISNPNAKYGIYDILFLFRSFKHLMVVFLWAINGRLLLDPTLVWWSNDVLINHTESTIEMCLTVWNWCIRVNDGTRVEAMILEAMLNPLSTCRAYYTQGKRNQDAYDPWGYANAMLWCLEGS